jgi:(2Fe-2S) ferredoxin
MDVCAKYCTVEVSREGAWYSCVKCKKGMQGFVIFELLVINLLEEL